MVPQSRGLCADVKETGSKNISDMKAYAFLQIFYTNALVHIKGKNFCFLKIYLYMYLEINTIKILIDRIYNKNFLFIRMCLVNH